MNNISSDKIIKLFPAVCEWIEQQENDIFSKGRYLTFNETQIAKNIGIKNFDIIKVFESEFVPQLYIFKLNWTFAKRVLS